MATEHFIYGGSAIERVIACPGSTAAIAVHGKREAGPAAERGTRIHEWLEKYLTGSYAKAAKSKKLSKQSQEEAKIAASAGLKIKELAAKHGFRPNQMVVEKKLCFKSVSEKAGGTPDVYLAQALGSLVVIDLKTGNKQVSAEENLQLLFYACAVVDNLDAFTANAIEDVVLYIVQPDQEAPYDCQVREWSIPSTRLGEYRELFRTAIQAAENNPQDLRAGNHCEDLYCDARTTCPAYRAWLNERSSGLLDALVSGTKVSDIKLQGEELAKLLSIKTALNNLLKKAEEDAIALLRQNPDSVPGYTLEDKLSNRKWADPEAVLRTAHDLGLEPSQVMVTEVISPAKFEALLKEHGLPEGLAPATVREPAGQALAKSKAPKLSAFEVAAPPMAPAAPALSLEALF
jgi:RecB family exonuclease